MKHLTYKDYTGSIEYSQEDNLLHGQVLGIKSLLSYEGETGNELEINFKETIDAYISMCAKKNIPPEKAFKGSFNVRISSELHKKAALLAMESQTSLNAFVAESIRFWIVKGGQ